MTLARAAEVLNTKRRNVNNWVNAGYFPGAIRLSELIDGMGGKTDPWILPADEVKGFDGPKMGRPKKPD